MKITIVAKEIEVAPGLVSIRFDWESSEQFTWVLPAQQVEEEAVVICAPVSRIQCCPRMKPTRQRCIIGGSVLGHLSRFGKIREFVASRSGFVSHALGGGAGARSITWSALSLPY